MWDIHTDRVGFTGGGLRGARAGWNGSRLITLDSRRHVYKAETPSSYTIDTPHSRILSPHGPFHGLRTLGDLKTPKSGD
jgi:hypothetical protein